MKCDIKGCDREATETYDYFGYELYLCEEGVRHSHGARTMVNFAQGYVVTRREMKAVLKSEAIERIMSPWGRVRE